MYFLQNLKKRFCIPIDWNLLLITSVSRAIDLYFPAHAEVYEDGLLSLPSKVKWFNADSTVHGTIGGLTELTLVRSTLNLMATSKTQVQQP